MRSYVVTILESVGVGDIVQVPSGFAALKELPGSRFDLIITDVNMPDINGLELIRYIRSSPTLAQVPMIAISTEGRDRDRERCLRLGANEYLAKPFRPEALIAAVQRQLRLVGQEM